MRLTDAAVEGLQAALDKYEEYLEDFGHKDYEESELEEIDRRVRAAREFLAAQESEPLSISFNGEASEAFADWIAQREGWYVRITPREGEPFDALLKGAAAMGWYDGVYFTRPDEDGLEIEGAPIEHTRVSDVYVY